MKPIPSIDLLQGKVVRLKEGKKEEVQFYDFEPAALIEKWLSRGAPWVHIVDLSSAFGDGDHKNQIFDLLKKFPKSLQIAGGIRSAEQVEQYLSNGAMSLAISTLAIKQPDLVEDLAYKFPKKLTLALDGHDGYVHHSGWTANSGKDAVEVFEMFSADYLFSVMYTEISRDGMSNGCVNETLKRLISKVKSGLQLDVVASGGVGNINHLNEVKDAGANFCVLGRALHEGNISLEQLESFWEE